MIGQPHDEGDEDRTEIVEELQTVHEDGYKLGGAVVIVDGAHGAGNSPADSALKNATVAGA